MGLGIIIFILIAYVLALAHYRFMSFKANKFMLLKKKVVLDNDWFEYVLYYKYPKEMMIVTFVASTMLIVSILFIVNTIS